MKEVQLDLFTLLQMPDSSLFFHIAPPYRLISYAIIRFANVRNCLSAKVFL